MSVCIAIGIFLNTRVNLVRLSTPDFPERGHVQLGMQLQAAGQLVPAIAQYRVALQVQEHYPPAYLQLGIALQRQGALAEATAAFEHYLSLTPLGNERQDVTARLVALRRAQGIDEPVVAGSARVSPASPAVSLPEAPPPPPRSVRVRERVTKAVDSLLAVPGRLATMRQGMLNEPGASVVDQHVVVKSATDMARYLPRGFAVVFLSPFPSQWLSRQGDAGPLRLLTGVETLAIYLLMLGAVLSARTSWGRQDEKRWFLLVFIGVSAAAFAIAVPNVGTLFRLRLQLIIPLVILVASTGGFSGYQRSFERLHVIVRRRRSSSPPPNPTSAR